MLLDLLLLLHLVVQLLLLTFGLRLEVCLFLLFFTSAQLRLSFGDNQIPRMLIQIELEIFSFKRLISIWNELTVLFNLFYLIQVLF